MPFQHATGPFLEPLRVAIHLALNRLPGPLAAFVLFGLKQAWACLFGGAMLGLLITTKYLWSPDWPVHRYDALFAAAILIQAAMLVFRLETLEEVKVIFVYHVVGTLMEVFKVHVGSWAYPEASIVQIAGVPLFSGFMYGSVGSYMARVIRVFDMRFARFPAPLWTFLLATAIYLNFFLHHFTYDTRILLFVATVLVYGRVRIHFTVGHSVYWMPLVLAAFLTSFFMWVAENVGTFTGTWVYPGQEVWHLVSLQKMGSWYLLLFISFTLVTLVVPIRGPDVQAPSN
ncbi:DUF817 domain-containing protein [Oryzibacter oryziterrae]|uniref:DUF817 domain-containing protein n=1 Tax=Oryzibacter oryziterrae TaxID=2766474 RepID=UPI001F22A2F5|nr:DUF817 domain-containing protein [Oryzibacter oryziterrae]